MIRIQGSMTRHKIGYVSQKAWIQNCSLRDAILGNHLIRTVTSRQLKSLSYRRISFLPNGDLTEIANANQFIGAEAEGRTARLIYSAKTLICSVFDDPLSALTTHASALFSSYMRFFFEKEDSHNIVKFALPLTTRC